MKNQSSITIGLIGPYIWIPGLQYNGSFVTSGYESINITRMSDLDQWDYSSWWFWNQKGAELAIQDINRDPTILPNTTIKIKRFNDFCPYGLTSNTALCGGQAMTTALEIYEQHPDVVAVFGDFFGGTAARTAEVFSHLKIPFCASSTVSAALLNKQIYPYFFETLTMTGFGNAIYQLLKTWNVKRVAIVSNQLNPCTDIVAALVYHGIQILQIIRLVSYKDAEYIANSLERVDARYIITCGSSRVMSDLYLTLGKMQRLVGPRYVWFTQNGFTTNGCLTGNCTADFGPEYYRLLKGVVQPYGINLNTPAMNTLQNKLVENIQKFQEPWGMKFDLDPSPTNSI
ncbi:periplasmic binding protein-like I [Rhizoclosmatium globosum]|uniref:Periplasmic binding protein-like I n=1 Tax=Rhizoclosmatium globosum TaxID=329046 RepID=A0A1Y2BWJ3_9FUNG|nr:periplasmic binding protein-like I [Rhizoclosmatium globosum]|eukprot:ORY39126.1 periplasmic binding protein-like I [Rhizoclosmatium globosum]